MYREQASTAAATAAASELVTERTAHGEVCMCMYVYVKIYI